MIVIVKYKGGAFNNWEKYDNIASCSYYIGENTYIIDKLADTFIPLDDEYWSVTKATSAERKLYYQLMKCDKLLKQ